MPTSCSTFRWWLIVGWDRSNAPARSHTHASPPGWEATSDISRSRTGPASAFSSGAICSARSADSGIWDSGGQHAALSAGLSSSTDFDTHLY